MLFLDLLRTLKHKINNKPSHKTVAYAQDGEDLVLKSLFEGQEGGFFVDVGAHHPKRFSNTYLFYQRGWRGINIEPMPGAKALFQKDRPNDITVECGVGTEKGESEFFVFSEPAFNTFNKSAVKQFEDRGYPQLVDTKKIPTLPLSLILETHLPPGQEIDFLTIDAEGWDVQVLKSNDWTRFRPKVVVVEVCEDLEGALKSDSVQFLKSQGYRMVAKTLRSAIHVRD